MEFTIIDMGKAGPEYQEQFGDFSHWFIRAFIDVEAEAGYRLVKVAQAKWRDVESADGVILTGAHEGVDDDLPWRDNFNELLTKLVESNIPTLAVCFGHQYLAQFLGGAVQTMPDGSGEHSHITVDLTDAAKKDPLFKGIPKHAGFIATHNDHVTKLPTGTRLLAANDLVPCHAFRYGHSVWGVQFHPEMDAELGRVSVKLEVEKKHQKEKLATIGNEQFGPQLMRNFIKICS